MVATADLWVYNAENCCVSFSYQVTSIFHLRGGKIKKKFFWAYLLGMIKIFGRREDNKTKLAEKGLRDEVGSMI